MRILLITTFIIGLLACKSSNRSTEVENGTELVNDNVNTNENYIINKLGDTLRLVVKTDAEWKEVLSEEEYYVLRQKGTERAFTSKLNSNKKPGLYTCAGCNTVLFTGDAKFDSGTGWPSFYKPEDPNLIKEDTDYNIGYARTEVLCARCGGHLGHVFPDGPDPTGLRYCINGVALEFVPELN